MLRGGIVTSHIRLILLLSRIISIYSETGCDKANDEEGSQLVLELLINESTKPAYATNMNKSCLELTSSIAAQAKQSLVEDHMNQC